MTKTTPTQTRLDAREIEEIRAYSAALFRECAGKSDDFLRGVLLQIRRSSSSRTAARVAPATEQRTDVERFDREDALKEIHRFDPALAREAAARSDSYIRGMLGQLQKTRGALRTDNTDRKVREDAFAHVDATATARAAMENSLQRACPWPSYAGGDPRKDITVDAVSREMRRQTAVMVGAVPVPEPYLAGQSQESKAMRDAMELRMARMAAPKPDLDERLEQIADSLDALKDQGRK